MADFSPRFLACLPFVLKEEGGYSNTPGDHGGANGGPVRAVKILQQVVGVSVDGEPHLNDVGAAAWSSVMYTSLIAYGAPF